MDTTSKSNLLSFNIHSTTLHNKLGFYTTFFSIRHVISQGSTFLRDCTENLATCVGREDGLQRQTTTAQGLHRNGGCPKQMMTMTLLYVFFARGRAVLSRQLPVCQVTVKSVPLESLYSETHWTPKGVHHLSLSIISGLNA